MYLSYDKKKTERYDQLRCFLGKFKWLPLISINNIALYTNVLAVATKITYGFSLKYMRTNLNNIIFYENSINCVVI